MIVADSGGLQEEGASPGVPVLVCREVTERPEGLEAGILRLAGTEKDQVSMTLEKALADSDFINRGEINPYGDGRAAKRVAQAGGELGIYERPEDWKVQNAAKEKVSWF